MAVTLFRIDALMELWTVVAGGLMGVVVTCLGAGQFGFRIAELTLDT